MTTDVLKLSGDYKIVTANAGKITLDTGNTVGDVVITGNLIVKGASVALTTTNVTIQDNIIVLNQGEPGLGTVAEGTAGIVVDRGNNVSDAYSAKLIWDDNAVWNIGTSNKGYWTFQNGNNSTQFPSAVKLNAVVFDGYGIDSSGRFPFILNGGVLSIDPSDTGYTSRIVDPNDIPNKEYVDNVPFSGTATSALVAKKIQDGNTYVEIFDDSVTGLESKIVGSINSVTNFIFSPNQAVFANIRVSQSEIEAIATNTNITLKTNGTGIVIVQNGVGFQSPVFPTWNPPGPAIGTTNVYSTTTTGAGSTGLLFNHTDGVNTVYGELISARKALLLGIIF
jgi:hypothetical protein